MTTEELPRRPWRSELPEHVAVAVAAGCWILWLTPASGGFHDPRTAVMAGALLPALILTRPWRAVHPALLLLTALAGAGALVVLQTTPPGWAQGDSPAAQLCGLLTLIVVTAYGRSPARRTAVAGVLIVAAMIEIGQAWLPWWGSGDPNHLMVGTFYWHNQLAAYLGALAALSCSLAAIGSAPLRRPALLVAPFAIAAVVLSTSRTSLGLVVASLLALLVLSLTQSPRRLAAVVALSVPVATAVVLLLLTSSAFFPDHRWSGPAATASHADATSPTAVLGDRGTSSLATNGGDRVRWSEAALAGWADRPLEGNGFGSFVSTSDQRLPAEVSRSAFVHNGYAEALTSGGILFGGPTLAVWLILDASCLMTLRRALARTSDSGVRVGAALASLLLLTHSAVDFDWHYASLVVLLGCTGGLVLSSDAPRPHPRRNARAAGAAGLALTVLAATTGSLIEHRGREALRRTSALALLDAQLPGTHDRRLQVRALLACSRAGQLSCEDATARKALDQTRALAGQDSYVRQLRRDLERLLKDR